MAKDNTEEPSRFHIEHHVPHAFPDEPSRIEILKVATASTPLTSDVNLEEIASKTLGFSGADLDNLCKEATLQAMTKAGLDNVESVDKADFDLVIKKFTICITCYCHRYRHCRSIHNIC